MKSLALHKQEPPEWPILTIAVKSVQAPSRNEIAMIKSTLSFVAHNENRDLTKNGFVELSQTCVPDSAAFVKAIVFDDLYRILAISNGRKVDLPSGKIEWDDDDAEAAARREVFETTSITLGDLAISTVIETMNSNDELEHTLVFSGRVKNEEHLFPTQICRHSFLSKESFLSQCTGNPGKLRQLIEMAEIHIVDGELRILEENHVAG